MSWHRLPPLDSAREAGGGGGGVGGGTGADQRSGLPSVDRMRPPANLPSLGDGFDRHLAPLVSPSFAVSPSAARQHQQPQQQQQQQQQQQPGQDYFSPSSSSSSSRYRSHSSSSYWDDHTRTSSRPTAPHPPQLPEPTSKFLLTSRQALPPLGAFGPSPTSPSLSVRSHQDYQSLHGGPRADGTASSVDRFSYQSGDAPTLSPPQSQSWTHSQSQSQSQPHLQAHHYQQQQPPMTFSPDYSRPYRDEAYTHRAPITAASRQVEETAEEELQPRKLAKTHVPSACLNCKRAHLACDVSRPCRRCVNLGKTDTCIDVQHKKRGRPRLRDREAAASAGTSFSTLTNGDGSTSSVTSLSGVPGSASHMRTSFSSGSSTSTMRRSPKSEPSSTSFISPTHEKVMIMSPIPTSDAADPLPPVSSSSQSSYSSSNRNRSLSSTNALWPAHHQSAPVPPPPAPFLSGSPREMEAAAASSPIISLVLSTSLQCARCSIESLALLGVHPSEVVDRSLFDFVHPSESNLLEQLWLGLIDPVGVEPRSVPVDLETVSTLSPALLMSPAPGTVFLQETIRLRQRSGMYDFYSVRLHLGGGFGADLYQSHTLHRAYIVASLLKLGNDATHAEPSMLRAALWDSGSDGRFFRAPVSARGSAYGPPRPSSSSTSTTMPAGAAPNGRFASNGNQFAWRVEDGHPPLKNDDLRPSKSNDKHSDRTDIYSAQKSRNGSVTLATSGANTSGSSPNGTAGPAHLVKRHPYTRATPASSRAELSGVAC